MPTPTTDPDWLVAARAEGRVLTEKSVPPAFFAPSPPVASPPPTAQTPKKARKRRETATGASPRAKRPGKGWSEAFFQSSFETLLRCYRWRFVHIKPAKLAKSWVTAVNPEGAGFPDLLCLRAGRQFVAELKVEPNTPSDSQKAWLWDFVGAGVPTFLWYPEHWPVIMAYVAGTWSAGVPVPGALLRPTT